MIAALDTDGRIYFTLSHANTDQDTFMLFMRYLVQRLDQETPGWQENSVILLENALYHVGRLAREYFRKMQIPVMYTAPYSYSASPIETLFSLLKFGEINKDAHVTISSLRKSSWGLHSQVDTFLRGYLNFRDHVTYAEDSAAFWATLGGVR